MNELQNKITKANEKKGANYTEIPSVLVAEMERVNNKIVTDFCKGVAMLDKADFINAFFNVTIEKELNEKDLEKAMKKAFSVEIVTLSINDNGLIEMGKKAKPIFFTDILKAKIDLLAFCHSDNKPTKEDRISANKHFFGDNGMGYLELLTHSARKFMSIEDKTENPNANYNKAFAEISSLCEKANKQNPFDKVSNTGFTEQIELLCQYFIGENACKMNAYHTKAIFQMICHRNKFGKFTIENINNVFNAFAIVYRYAFNGYKLPTNDKSTIYKVFKEN